MKFERFVNESVPPGIISGWYQELRDLQGLLGPKEIRHWLIGRVFRESAYRLLSTRAANHRHHLMSPEETFQCYQILYPEAQAHFSPFGNNGLMGISVPGGHLYDENGLVEVVWYTMSRDLEGYVGARMQGLTVRKKNITPLFDRASMRVVVPRDTCLPYLNSDQDIGVEFTKIEYPAKCFRDLVNGVLSGVVV